MPKTITRTVYTYKELRDLHKNGEIKAECLEKAKWKLFEIATEDDFWYESTFDDWKTALKQIGFPDSELRFTGFSSQGDGASFTCDRVDHDVLIKFMSQPRTGRDCVDSYIRGSKETEQDFRDWLVFNAPNIHFNTDYKKLLRVRDYLSMHVECIDRHYSHWNTCRFRLEYDDYYAKTYHPHRTKAYLDLLDDLARSFREDCEKLRKDISNSLYRHLENDYRAQGEDDYLEDFGESNGFTFLRNGKFEQE
jgi:hypothetical protein